MDWTFLVGSKEWNGGKNMFVFVSFRLLDSFWMNKGLANLPLSRSLAVCVEKRSSQRYIAGSGREWRRKRQNFLVAFAWSPSCPARDGIHFWRGVAVRGKSPTRKGQIRVKE